MSKFQPTITHKNHPISIIQGPFGPHHAKMMCTMCKTFIKWATKKEVKTYKQLIKENKS